MSEQIFRHEYKYVISNRSAALLRHQMDALLARDRHAGADGRYHVRSIYFDDDSLTSFHEKLNGVKERAKYRLRFYNMDASRLALEVKRKYDRLVRKDAFILSPGTAKAILTGAKLSPAERQEPLLAEFDALRAHANLKPSVIVDYQRTAFVYPIENTRITLDSGMSADAYRYDAVFFPRAGVPAIADGQVILEVKFDAQLPEFIAHALAGVPKILSAHSKYCHCLAMYL